jgi:hypothetical protein
MDHAAGSTPMTTEDAEALLDCTHADVVILPSEINHDGLALFEDGIVELFKELRAAGIDVSYSHPKSERSWLARKSFFAVAGTMLLGVGSSAAWAAICAIFRRQPAGGSATVKIVRTREKDGEITREWYEFKGPADEIADQMRAIEPGPGDDDSS